MAKTLVSNSKWMISGHVGLTATLAIVTGLYVDNTHLLLVGAFLLGVVMAPLAPVWKQAISEKDERYISWTKLGHFPVWYWCAVSMAILLSVVNLAQAIFVG